MKFSKNPILKSTSLNPEKNKIEFQKNARQKKLIEREKKLRSESEKTLQNLIFKYQRSTESKLLKIAKRSFEFDFDIAENPEEEDFIALDNAYKRICSESLFEPLPELEKKSGKTGVIEKEGGNGGSSEVEGLTMTEKIRQRYHGLKASNDFGKLAFFDMENNLQVFNFRESNDFIFFRVIYCWAEKIWVFGI